MFKKLLSLVLVVSFTFNTVIYANSVTEEMKDIGSEGTVEIIKNQVDAVGVSGKVVFNVGAELLEIAGLQDMKGEMLSKVKVYAVEVFVDIKSSDWFADSMSKLVGIGVLNGYDGKLNPNEQIKADEFVKMTITAMGYTDIQNGSEYWAMNYIVKATELGLVRNGEFDEYNRAITREEMARIIVRVVNEDATVDMDKVSAAFTDWSTVTYKDDFAKAVMLGIMGGYPDRTVRAAASATRAEATTMIVRLIDPSARF